MDLVNVTLSASPKKVKPGTTVFQYLQVFIDADDMPDIKERRTPINLCLVLDRSGSMQGKKIEYVIESGIEIIKNMKKNDIISVILFSTKAETIIKATHVNTKNKSKIIDKVRQIETGGSTALHQGLIEGIEQIKANLNKKITNRIILMSDGEANVGLRSLDEIQNNIKNEINANPITISSFGVGEYFNEELIQGIADEFRGNYYYIEEADFIPRLILRELTGILSLMWRDLNIKFISDSEGIEIQKVLGYDVTNHTSFVGEIRALDELYVICKYSIPSELSNNGKIKVILSYKDMFKDPQEQEKEVEFIVKITIEDSDLIDDLPIIINLELFSMGTDIELARENMEKGEYDIAGELLESRISIMKELSEKDPNDSRLNVKLKFLEKMLDKAKSRSYDSKFSKMSSYYYYSTLKSRYRTKSMAVYSKKMEEDKNQGKSDDNSSNQTTSDSK